MPVKPPTIAKKGARSRSGWSVGWGPVIAAALFTCSRRAATAEIDSPLVLDWAAPAGCPTQDEVIDRVRAILGRSSVPGGRLSVRAIASRAPSGQWRVDLVAVREGGAASRNFEAESCEAAAEATALIVGLMIDPDVASKGRDVGEVDAASRPGPTIRAGHQSGPTASPPAPDASPPPPGPPLSKGPRGPIVTRAPLFGLRTSIAGDVGTFSSPNVGGEVLLVVMPWRRLRFELAGSHWLSWTATLAGTPSEGAWLELNTLGVRAAYLLSGPDVGIAPLVGVEGDQMSATGFGGTSRHHRTAMYAGIDLGVTGLWFPIPDFHAFALTLTLEAVVATERPPPFVATEPGATDRVVHQSSPIASRPFLGVECLFF